MLSPSTRHPYWHSLKRRLGRDLSRIWSRRVPAGLRRPSWPFRIATRIFALNVLLLLVPVLALGFFRNYEESLLSSQEHAMTQQGRILAAWLSASPEGQLEPAARSMLAALERKHTARFRVIDTQYRLIADSAVEPAAQLAEPAASVSLSRTDPYASRSTLVYRLLSLPVRVWRQFFARPTGPLESVDYYEGSRQFDGAEVRSALAGNYGAVTRISPAYQASVTLYSALPVRQDGKVVAAILVSQSTWRILENLYDLRLDAGRIFLYGMVLALLGTVVLSLTITRPLEQLAKAARQAVARGNALRLPAGVLDRSTRRPDEIGDLQRSLQAFAKALHERAGRAEAFASDVAHELKNPITSVRALLEAVADSNDDRQKKRFLASARRDLDRMLEVLGSLRALAAAEAVPTDSQTAAPAAPLIRELVRDRQDTRIGKPCLLVDDALTVPLRDSAWRLVVGNLLDNACGFCPPDGRIFVLLREAVAGNGRELELLVADDGPGIPPEHRDRIFERFFTWRPGQDRRDHSGLGLAIVRALLESAGGAIRLAVFPILTDEIGTDCPGLAGPAPSGACFSVRLPLD